MYPLGTTHLWAVNGLGLANNDPVANVPDSVGSKDAAQSNASYKPTYKTNRYNGFPSIQFDGTNDFLETPSIPAKSDWSVVFLAKPSATSGAYFIDASTDGLKAIIQSFTTGKWEYYNSPRTEIGDVSTSAWQCIGSNVGSTGTANWIIGKWSGGDAFLYSGEFIAIRVWDSALNSSELAAAIAQMLADYEPPTPETVNYSLSLQNISTQIGATVACDNPSYSLTIEDIDYSVIPEPSLLWTSDFVAQRYRYFEKPKNWDAVTRNHEYEDGGKSFNELSDSAPQEWEIIFTGKTPEEVAVLDLHFDTYRKSRPFNFLTKEGDVISVYYKEYERIHEANRSWVQQRHITLIKYP